MKLKSFGCSFIFGTDLVDDGGHLPTPTHSNHTWPALLAKNFGYNYECYARPGSGNLQIAERVLSHITDSEPAFFVIGWTWIDRFDYTDREISNGKISAQWCNWNTLMPSDRGNVSKNYFQNLNSEFRDKISSLIYIKLVIDTLQQKNIPFLMTYMDTLMFDQQWNHTPAVLTLQDFIKPYMHDFEGKNFLDWSRGHGYSESSAWHPLEQAHQGAADVMLKIFDKQKTNDPAQQVRV